MSNLNLANSTNLKPFNLKAALEGEPVILGDGGKAFVRHHETELSAPSGERLLGYLASGSCIRWHEDGGFFDRSIGRPCLDIIGMYPKTVIIDGFEVLAPETETTD